MKGREVIVKQKTLTGIKVWMNEEFKEKKSGKPFLLNDVQNYVKRGNLPKYLGNFTVVEDNSVEGVKLYKIVK